MAANIDAGGSMTYDDLIALSSGVALSGVAPAAGPAPVQPPQAKAGALPTLHTHAASGGLAVLIFGLLALAFGHWAGGK